MIKKTILFEGKIFESSKKKLQKFFILKKINFNNIKDLNKIYGLYLNLVDYYSEEKLNIYPNLKFIISPTTGLNHIDLPYCRKKKIQIISLGKQDFLKKKIYSTAELSLTFILMAVKKVNQFNELTKNFFWNRYEYKINEFDNYKIGIIGYGRVGRILSKQLKVLRLNVDKYDKHENKKSLYNLLKSSDVISIHIPAKNNKNFINKDKLEICKKDVSIINTSRGEVINEKDLINFLKKNKYANAFIDVINNEQRRIMNIKNNKIILYQKKNKNLFITPHIGGVSLKARQITQDLIVNKFLNKMKI